VNRRQLASIAYLREENRVLREQLGAKRPKFTDPQRRRLAKKGQALGRKALAELCSIATPDTILGWYRRLIAKKYDGERPRGRPRKTEDICELILRMAEENSGWGYTRIVGAMKNLGHDVGRMTVARVLAGHGMDPAPERRRGTSWHEFLRIHWDGIAAADFFTVAQLTRRV
jgi:putative transposase